MSERFSLHSDLETTGEIQPLDEIITGVLATEQVGAWSGDGGTGKTWSCFDLGVAVAYESKWIGFEMKGGPVLIVDEQSGHRRMSRRMRDVLAGHDIRAKGRVSWLTFPHFKLVSRPKDAEALRAAIKATGARLVIIDALLNLVESKVANPENDSVSIGALFSVLRGIAYEYQCAIILIHHTNRQGGFRGSSAIKDEGDFLVIVTRPNESSPIQFKSEKSRDHTPFKFSAQMNFAQGSFNLSSSSEGDEKEKRLSKSMNYCLEFWVKHGDSVIKDMAGPDAPFKENTLRSAINDLVTMGRAVRKDSGGSGVIGTYGLPVQRTITI